MVSIPTLLSGSEMILAISHPLQRRMLRVLVDADEPVSLERLTRAFDLPIGTARYHANVLCGFGAVEPTRPDAGDDRGEYLYDATVDGDPEASELTQSGPMQGARTADLQHGGKSAAHNAGTDELSRA